MKIAWKNVENYRTHSYRMSIDERLCTADDAVQFVNQRGFVFFWPGKDLPLPSLWNAVVGNRPVPNDHDDPGHITWDWKDSLLDKKVWYYGRILDNRNTMLSMQMLSCFYALSPNYGDYETDYLEAYQRGEMSNQSKLIYEALLHEGALDTLALRKAARMTSENTKSSFLKHVNDLQKTFHILPIGISRSGGWRYAFIYEIAARYLPDIPKESRTLTLDEAKIKIASTYLKSIGAGQARYFMRLFRWTEDETNRTIRTLEETGFCQSNVEISDVQGRWIVLSDIEKA